MIPQELYEEIYGILPLSDYEWALHHDVYTHNNIWSSFTKTSLLVCSRSLIALLIRSIGGLSNSFYQSLRLVDLSADMIGQSIDRRGVIKEFPHHVTVCLFFLFCTILYGFPYRFQRTWTVLWSTRHPLDVVQVGSWNSLHHSPFSPYCCPLQFITQWGVQSGGLINLPNTGAKSLLSHPYKMQGKEPNCSTAQHTETWTKWLSFCRRNFQMHFCDWKYLYFHSNFPCSKLLIKKSALFHAMAWRLLQWWLFTDAHMYHIASMC